MAVNFLEPIVTRFVIYRALDALLSPVCQQLSEAGEGALAGTLRAFRADRDVQEITVGKGLPTRTPAHLRRLFDNDLELLELDLGVERTVLEAGAADAMDAAKKTMATNGLDDASRSEALAQLLDRQSQRLPVWRLASAESHWPERSVTRVGTFDSVPDVLLHRHCRTRALCEAARAADGSCRGPEDWLVRMKDTGAQKSESSAAIHGDGRARLKQLLAHGTRQRPELG